MNEFIAFWKESAYFLWCPLLLKFPFNLGGGNFNRWWAEKILSQPKCSHPFVELKHRHREERSYQLTSFQHPELGMVSERRVIVNWSIAVAVRWKCVKWEDKKEPEKKLFSFQHVITRRLRAEVAIKSFRLGEGGRRGRVSLIQGNTEYHNSDIQGCLTITFWLWPDCILNAFTLFQSSVR